MRKPNDLSRSLTVLKEDNTLIAVIEMSQSSWLVGGIVPSVERQPLKKLATDECALIKLLDRWRREALKRGAQITRIAVAKAASLDTPCARRRQPPAVGTRESLRRGRTREMTE